MKLNTKRGNLFGYIGLALVKITGGTSMVLLYGGHKTASAILLATAFMCVVTTVMVMYKTWNEQIQDIKDFEYKEDYEEQ